MKILFITWILLIFAVIAGVSAPVHAARERDDVPERESFSPESPISSPLIERMQTALKDAGYYKGPINGILNATTDAAIRTYQRHENLAVDGIITEKLVSRLETSINVQSLLKQLQHQRLLKIEAARTALMQSPETRHLLSGNKPAERTADPTRNPAPCFADPAPLCLLQEASESAKGIFRAELRNWALSEILVTEAKAGLVDMAMNTIRRIEDPRLMIVALRDIAEAQARSNRPAEALAAANIIPDATKRAEALAAIAIIQATATGKTGGIISIGNRAGALATVKLLFETLPTIDSPLKRVALQMQGAVIQHHLGDTAAAVKTLAEARNSVDRLPDRKIRNVGLRHVADALAEIALPEQALEILKELPEQSEHTPVLVSAASAQALAGDAKRALITAEAIKSVRYRAVVLGRIAIAQATAGDMTAVGETLEKAFEAISNIDLPFAQAYAHERIAQALISIGQLQARSPDRNTSEATFLRAVKSADKISDNMLRARTLWTIADAQRISGDMTSAEKTELRAEAATASIQSMLTKVWMFCNIATDRQAEGTPEPARKAFGRALKLTENISNPWGRARALARLASTQVDLSAGD